MQTATRQELLDALLCDVVPVGAAAWLAAAAAWWEATRAALVRHNRSLAE